LTSKPSSMTAPPRSAEMSTYARSRDMRSLIDNGVAQGREIEGLADSTIRWHSAYSVNNRRPPDEPPAERAPYNRLDTGARLIVIGLLSLGLWAAIWAAAASLMSSAGALR
jgi:hypothetical protein